MKQSIKEVFDRIYSHWILFLAILFLAIFIISIVIFYPGYMSNDSLNQLRQVIGIDPFGDWHPPIMVLVWKVLFQLSNSAASMLIFQELIYLAAMFIVSAIIYKRTGNRKISLLPVLIVFLPFVLTISGVIWKDVQMAYALLLSVSLIVMYSLYSSKFSLLLKSSIVVVIAALLIYAALLRYNALPAIIPIIYLAVNAIAPSAKKLPKILYTGLFTVGILITGAVLNMSLNVTKEHPTSSVMIDDIININNIEELKQLDDPLRHVATQMQNTCLNKRIIMNSYWRCADDAQRKVIHQDQYIAVKNYWIASIVKHPVKYVAYRGATFSEFLFGYNPYTFQAGVRDNDLGVAVKSKNMQHILRMYVVQFGYNHFSFLYQPWFWLIAALIIYRIGQVKLKTFGITVRVLAVSSILYTLSYIPVMVASDYRYIYWSVLACLLSIIFIIIDNPKGFRVKNITKDLMS